MYIDNINSPKDLKKLNINVLNILSDEIRRILIKRLSEFGGHIGPNLGMVELTIAIHYVFNSPVDKIVFDVSHQSYTHKILTGRKEYFTDSNKYADISGFFSYEESEHDSFKIGHTSTSLSLANGLAKARDLKGDKENIIALIGDGSLSGGEAYEGLNNIIETGTNTIVIVNDNNMSIAETHGGLYQNLKILRETKGAYHLNFFKSLGFEYYYLDDGHNIESLIKVLTKVKDSKKPVLIHVHTIKGKGLSYAEKEKEIYHSGGPFEISDGKYKKANYINYPTITADYLLEKMKDNKSLVAITSATPIIFGFNKEKRLLAGNQFYDVGICEEHAIAMISGLAKNGATPVYGVLSTFLQRCYDQLSQDLCLNNNPAVILVFGATSYGAKDITHFGIYDIPMISNIPNLVYLAPTNKEEYLAMLDYAIKQKAYPIAIRVPGNEVITTNIIDTTDYSIINKYEVVKKGKDVAIIALGTFFEIGRKVSIELTKHQINSTLINPKFITGLDIELLKELEKEHKLVITLEDGCIDGGWGQKISSFYGLSNIKVKNYGIKKYFPDRSRFKELLKDNGISVEQITDDVNKLLNIYLKGQD